MPNPSSQTRPASRSKRGGLARQRRTRSLRRRPGYGSIQLVSGGLAITCRESDGFVNLSEVFAAEAEARGGKPRRLAAWLRLGSTPPFLQAVEGADPDVRNLTSGSPAERLIDRAHGRDTWAHHQVACEVAGWLSPPLRVAINQLWFDTVSRKARRPRPLDASGAAIVRARKDASLNLAEAAHARGCPPAWANRVLVHALTGRAPEVWSATLGEGWLERTSLAFQAAREAAARAAAGAIADLDGEPRKRDILAAVKAAVRALLAAWRVDAITPSYDGPAFSAGRLERLLTAA